MTRKGTEKKKLRSDIKIYRQSQNIWQGEHMPRSNISIYSGNISI